MIFRPTFCAAFLAGVLPLAVAAQSVDYGPDMPLAAGTVRAFAVTDAAGRATRIGVEMTEAAVASLEHEMVFITVPLPKAAIEADYDHVSLDWMPHGHEPEGMFTVPHFDVHFYMTTEAERLAIAPDDPLFLEKAANRPSADLMPANFVPPPTPQPVPAMGEHWLDATDPVLSGQPFEAVLIYGAWDGEVTFVEPMVTRDLLLSKRELGGDLAQPARVAEEVSLSGAWHVGYDAEAGVHRVSIDGLVARVPGASEPKTTTN